MNTDGVKRFFSDLYRDLDDRHMLLPAIALLVAIVAVPMLLGGSSDEVVPAPAPAPLDADATAVESAVLTSNPGIRDYRKRLQELKEKNPFVQQFAEGETAETAVDDTGAEVPTGTTGTTDTATGTAPTDGGGTSVPPIGDETSTETPPATPEDTTEPTGEETTEPEVVTETRFYAPRVDVTFGELGAAKQYENVRYFDFLPNEREAVVAFLGLGESADKAVFAVSNQVTETAGEGSCAPHEVDGCDLLILRVGEQRTLKVETGGIYGETITYRLKVLDTHFQRVPDPREQAESGG